ncbi:MAG: 1,4-alpha-glucan branching protein GlgB [Acidimicrobiia bacterium]|nr:1,4-alpha-glucan branching protein GlgB [Acidimicrobiia bacterium]
MVRPVSIEDAAPIAELDLWRFNEGTHDGLAHVLGAHLDETGCTFRVWAPAARSVSVIGDFDDWSGLPLVGSDSGIWSGRVRGAHRGERYLYRVVGEDGSVSDKADPVASATEEPPSTASRIWTLDYEWGDAEWMNTRAARNAHDAPISAYEVHLGSWKYEPGGYRALAHQLADHLDRMAFTHVELLPVMEHPFYGSWGYQTLGYFAPTARYGSPQDLMYLVDLLHQRGYGVLLDWVPSHFPTDVHGLARFDGTHLYEHADPRLGFHPDWKSAIFNYDRHEVRSFLLSSARHWLEAYHADGLRVDAVASMLYRDYSRRAGEWIPNEFGGRENLGAVAFLQELNRQVYLHHPDTMTVAEESTAWPGVTRPTDDGGLGFGFKWDMGWMNDTLRYIDNDPVHRHWHHDEITFRMVYAFDENFVLPLSHDEVVHGKGSLLSRQPGDRWQQFAGLRVLLGYQFGQPGKKLLFMGSEFAMDTEWSHEEELPWALLDDPDHAGVADWVTCLNQLYRDEPALHRADSSPAGFSWVIGDDADNSVLAFLRHAGDERSVLVVCNFTPVPRTGYRIGVPRAGRWIELANGDELAFGGSGVVNGELETDDVSAHGFDVSLSVTVPPLAVVFIAPDV